MEFDEEAYSSSTLTNYKLAVSQVENNRDDIGP